jgi:hypothetical protein
MSRATNMTTRGDKKKVKSLHEATLRCAKEVVEESYVKRVNGECGDESKSGNTRRSAPMTRLSRPVTTPPMWLARQHKTCGQVN